MLKCPACQSVKVELTSDRYTYLEQQYKRYACTQCDLHFWDPLTVDVETIYNAESIPLYKAYHQGLMGAATSHPYFEELSLSGRLLDVGCANGGFMQYALKKGFQCYGLDFDEKSIDDAKKNGISNVWPISLEEFSKTAGSELLGTFDVVTFFDVLEHQTDPATFIEEVKAMVAPGGYIVGKVPNRNRVLAKVRRHLDYDYPPHHTLMWSEASVSNYLERAGFKVVSVKVAEFSFLPYVWHMEKKLIGRGLKQLIKGKVFSIDRDVAYVPTERLEAATGKRGGVVRVLKRIEDLFFSLLVGAAYPWMRKKGTHIHFAAIKI